MLRLLGLASCLPEEEINEMCRRGKVIGDVYTAQSNSRIIFFSPGLLPNDYTYKRPALCGN